MGEVGFSTNVPHFALPFSIAANPDGTYSARTVDQESQEEVHNCVEAVIRYEKGYRPEKPEFGITDHTFSMGELQTLDIVDDVRDQEPRAQISIRSQIDTIDQFISYMTVSVGDNTGGDNSD